MGREELRALVAIIQAQLELGTEGVALGAWHIHLDKARGAFVFDRCENEGYCEERPAVVAFNGDVVDPGGPLFG
jgi:hypothetical protein